MTSNALRRKATRGRKCPSKAPTPIGAFLHGELGVLNGRIVYNNVAPTVLHAACEMNYRDLFNLPGVVCMCHDSRRILLK